MMLLFIRFIINVRDKHRIIMQMNNSRSMDTMRRLCMLNVDTKLQNQIVAVDLCVHHSLDNNW